MRYRYILLSMIFILFYSLIAFAYNEQDIDLYNHSNQHGVIFHAEDKRAYYDNITYDVISSGKCSKEQYKLIKNTAKKLKDKEQPFWVYKYCISAEYKYNTDSIIKANYLYYLGMRNNIIEWSEDNNTMHITLPIMFSGIITTMSLEEDKSILVKEIFVYDRPEGLPQNGGYKDLFIK